MNFPTLPPLPSPPLPTVPPQAAAAAAQAQQVMVTPANAVYKDGYTPTLPYLLGLRAPNQAKAPVPNGTVLLDPARQQGHTFDSGYGSGANDGALRGLLVGAALGALSVVLYNKFSR